MEARNRAPKWSCLEGPESLPGGRKEDSVSRTAKVDPATNKENRVETRDEKAGIFFPPNLISCGFPLKL